MSSTALQLPVLFVLDISEVALEYGVFMAPPAFR